MIFLFNNREELCGLIEFSELSSLTHILEINAFDLSTFEVPVEYVFGKLGEAQFFGFFLDPDNPQPDSFKIFKIREKSIGDTLVVSGIDKAESDLKQIKIIEDKRPNGNPAKILSVILEGTGYQVGVVSNLEQLSKQLYFYYLSPKEALAKLIEAFKCEFSITYTLNNNRITARHVNLYQKMGRDSGQQYEHGSDLLSVVYEEEADNVVTALIGRGKGEAIEDDEGLKTGGYSRRIDFKDVVWSKANGNPLDKPLGQNYLALENSAYALYQDGVAKHRFGVFIAEDIEDKNELINATYKELLSLSVPVTTYKAELVELYSGAWLGDSIAIFRDDAGIAFAARLYKIKVDKLDHNRSTVELGEYEAFKKLEVSSNSRLSMAMSDIKALAEGALKSADGKNTLFGDLSEPTNAREGDIWFKRNGNEDEMWQYRLIDGRLQWVYVTGDRYAKQIKEQVDSQFAEVSQQITEQQQAHDRTVAEILAQVDSTQSLAEQAKAIGDQAKADAVNLASQLSTAKIDLQNSIAEAKAQAATVANNLATAKSDLQNQVTAINAKAVKAQTDVTQAKSDLQTQAEQLNAQATKQVELTKLTTDTKKLADGTLTTLNELSKTVDKNTGNITSVTNRTKAVEDDLSGTKTKLEQVKTTADTTSRKTAEIQAKVEGVTERFEDMRVGGRNYISDYSFEKSHTFNSNTSAWKHERIADATARSGYHIKATCTKAGGGGFHKPLRDLRGAEWQGRTMTYAVDIKASKSVRMRLGVEVFNTGYKTIDVTTNWQRFVSTDVVNFKVWYSFPFYTDGVEWAVGDIIYIRDPQLEDGNVATTPHAAEEDLSNQLAEYKRTSDQNYSGLQSTVQTLDGKITQNKSEQLQTAEGFKTRLSSLETYKDAEGNRAQAYFEAARTETAKQITAERSVVAQNYTAKSTYIEDYNGITRRLTATETVANNTTTRLATYQNTNDRRVAALESNKISTDGTLTQLSNKVEQNAQQTRETISAVEAKIPTSIGTRNYLLATDKQRQLVINKTNGYVVNDMYHLPDTLSNLGFVAGDVVCLSFDYATSNKTSFTNFRVELYNTSSGYLMRIGDVTSSDTGHFTGKLTLSANHLTGNMIKIRHDNTVATFTITKARLTKNTFADWSLATEDLVTEISNAKLDIAKTSDGLKLVADKSTVNGNILTQHTTQITALNNELSAKVSKTDYDTLTGRMTSAETTIRAQAGEISKRLTSTQVESAIIAKGYQTKAQVDSNIAGRGYITSSALQPYATTTVLENKVKETSDSFNRTISAVRLEIPTNASMRNLILKSSDKWGSYTSTNNANSNWCPEICRITLDSDRGISVGKKLNLFVYISADNVTLDSSSNHRMAIQAAIIKKDGTNLWHADVPFHGQWSQNLKAGNNYYVIKLTKEIKTTAYENGATLIVQCRIDGANHVDFHHRAAMITTGDMFPDVWYPAPEDMATVVAFNKVSDAVDHHAQTLKDQEGRINTVLQTATTAYQLLQDGGRIYEDLKTVKGQIQQVRDANYATRIETLAGSWAVKNLTSGGQMLNQFNLLANGINHIDGRLTHITGDTLIDRGVIKSAMIGNGQIGTAHIGTIDASQANIINLNVNTLVGFDATFIKGKFDNVIADLLKGKIVAAQNGAMVVDLLNAKLSFRDDANIEFNSDNNTLRRISSSKPSQFIKFTEAGFVSELGSLANSTLTIIGSNADRTETAENQSFGGLRIWNGIKSSSENTSFVEVVGNRFAIYGNKYRSPWVFDATTKTSKLIPMNENGINHSIGRDDKRIWDIHTSNLYLSGKGLKEVINNLYWHITLIYAGNYENKDKSNMFIF